MKVNVALVVACCTAVLALAMGAAMVQADAVARYKAALEKFDSSMKSWEENYAACGGNNSTGDSTDGDDGGDIGGEGDGGEGGTTKCPAEARAQIEQADLAANCLAADLSVGVCTDACEAALSAGEQAWEMCGMEAEYQALAALVQGAVTVCGLESQASDDSGAATCTDEARAQIEQADLAANCLAADLSVGDCTDACEAALSAGEQAWEMCGMEAEYQALAALVQGAVTVCGLESQASDDSGAATCTDEARAQIEQADLAANCLAADLSVGDCTDACEAALSAGEQAWEMCGMEAEYQALAALVQGAVTVCGLESQASDDSGAATCTDEARAQIEQADMAANCLVADLTGGVCTDACQAALSAGEQAWEMCGVEAEYQQLTALVQGAVTVCGLESQGSDDGGAATCTNEARAALADADVVTNCASVATGECTAACLTSLQQGAEAWTACAGEAQYQQLTALVDAAASACGLADSGDGGEGGDGDSEGEGAAEQGCTEDDFQRITSATRTLASSCIDAAMKQVCSDQCAADLDFEMYATWDRCRDDPAWASIAAFVDIALNACKDKVLPP